MNHVTQTPDRIVTKNLNKIYHTFEKEAGFKGSVKSLFKKKRVEKQAIREFNLEIEKGEFVGLIGPNGAGKTTLIKMLTGIIHPTAGELSVFGYTPYQLKDDKRHFGIVPHNSQWQNQQYELEVLAFYFQLPIES